MSEWKYNGKEYTTIPMSWVFNEGNSLCDGDYSKLIEAKTLVYVPKWDKCYYLISLQHSGNGRQLKACIQDIYNKRVYFVEARRLELVIEKQYEFI